MKTLFITGGNGAIGRAIANKFKSEGFDVIAPSSLELDCSNERSIQEFFKGLNATMVTAFVHCAGINNPKKFTDSKPETMNRAMQINTMSMLSITQHLNNLFEDGTSRVVAISSIYGVISRPGRVEYTTSKHALNGMVQSLALELAARKILVNAISPGFIATELTYKNNAPEILNAIIADVPLKQLGEPQSVAELAFFLCSDKNKFITGQNVIIDGGYTIGGFQS